MSYVEIVTAMIIYPQIFKSFLYVLSLLYIDTFMYHISYVSLRAGSIAPLIAYASATSVLCRCPEGYNTTLT
jgi:hypothetical protein